MGGGCDPAAFECTWTTSWDSVEQVTTLFEELDEHFCFDLDRVWAVGCSNGGMFTYELARDERSAPIFKGIVPIVGLPHYGYSTGPAIPGTSIFAMLGRHDSTVSRKTATCG